MRKAKVTDEHPHAWIWVVVHDVTRSLVSGARMDETKGMQVKEAYGRDLFMEALPGGNQISGVSLSGRMSRQERG